MKRIQELEEEAKELQLQEYSLLQEVELKENEHKAWVNRKRNELGDIQSKQLQISGGIIELRKIAEQGATETP